ncbi:MAG TPA: glutathione S-transferase family protein, partial [Woeseiaceae bacterium]|nr:glutathione S-transferase family protein [Woeseiaceae bacterium]
MGDKSSIPVSDTLKVYGDSRSGNCYKIKLLCAELGIGYQWQEIDILAGETRTPEFLAMNPNGKIPLLALSNGGYLSESNAILAYLADGTGLMGGDAFERATVLQWMFFEQYSHEPNIATSRFVLQYLGNPPERRESLEEKRVGGYRALGVMELALSKSPFLAGEKFTAADICLFAYTHVADEGGFSLQDYPAIRA